MMTQYVEAKARYPEALLFFRMGDFYEMFFGDAENAGLHLGLTVTSRNKDAAVPEPMSGFPHHQLPSYLNKALEAGFKVAVCDQLSDPTTSKLVERGVTQVITPGVVLDGESLQERDEHFLVAVCPQGYAANAQGFVGGELFGLAALDVSTGAFKATEVLSLGALRCELARLEPKELLLPAPATALASALRARFPAVALTALREEGFFDEAQARRLLQRLKSATGAPAAEALGGYGFALPALPTCAAGAAVAYVIDTQRAFPESVHQLNPYRMHESLVLDETASQNLELHRTLIGKRKRGSLLGVLDRASTPMGARRLKRWMSYPLLNPDAINARLDAVERLKGDATLRLALREQLKQVSDLERLNTRAALGKSSPRELAQIRDTLARLPDLCALLTPHPTLAPLAARVGAFPDLSALLTSALTEEPPQSVKDGGVIRPGFDEQLDELNALASDGQDWLVELERRERERTGINTLKVRYNSVFGYYIELTKANLHLAPSHYLRRQTLANAERFITEELKEFEDKVLNAAVRREQIEADLFKRLRDEVAAHAGRLAASAEAVADLDALWSLAEVAHAHGYCRPAVDDGRALEIVGGRHPVVEQAVGRESFIPNDVYLDADGQRLMIITGPNMAGKSTVMRQVALITLMAQMGSFVPAAAARVGVVDRIFTRVGAADDLASGRSTFMVEMSETATILQEATAQSLVILDEIGRGTSTFDGVSIAWAVAEHLHDAIGARALFATHYHELTALADDRAGAKNFTVAVSQDSGKVVFSHLLTPGAASRSYGIQVAELAGLPKRVIERAQAVLRTLEEGDHHPAAPRGARGAKRERVAARGDQDERQLSLFSPPLPAASSEVERVLRSVDLDQLSPLNALQLLHALAEKARRS
ncbi:MAG: DNA mismatch repair protein MutS [Deltaproteobacteria bacterium]|nr:DNA mismatch repair protein MutS [Deltaproteobacteria bacterium]